MTKSDYQTGIQRTIRLADIPSKEQNLKYCCRYLLVLISLDVFPILDLDTSWWGQNTKIKIKIKFQNAIVDQLGNLVRPRVLFIKVAHNAFTPRNVVHETDPWIQL